jgi:hypothetical protein
MPLSTKLENRRRALRHSLSGRPHKTPYAAQKNPGMPSDTTMENRRQASRREKAPYLEHMRPGTPLEMTLEKER